MTPREYAEKLIVDMYENTTFRKGTAKEIFGQNNDCAKKCAKICVEEILNAQQLVYDIPEEDLNGQKFNKFWNDVKWEIENYD